MFEKDNTLQKLDDLSIRYAKEILNLSLMSSPYENAAVIKSLVETENEFEKNIDVKSVIADTIRETGFDYDKDQGIFYSIIDAWQYDYGYCRLYDEFSAPISLIFDCDPIYFDYNNKRWLIEFWKGQYGMCTGAEVGVYSTEITECKDNIDAEDVFYNKISPEEFLDMSFVLKKNGKDIIKRKDKHWWLTGFILGEYSEPEELSVDIKITLKDDKMRDAFIQGLYNAGYKDKEIKIDGNTVGIYFNKPKTKQPYTNIKALNYLMQLNNKYLCIMYKDITKPYKDYNDKLKAVKEQSPLIYNQIMDIGKWNWIIKLYKAAKLDEKK